MTKSRSSPAPVAASAVALRWASPTRASKFLRRAERLQTQAWKRTSPQSPAITPTITRSAEVFERIQAAAGRLDILVNVAWGGYERMVEDGKFTWAVPFWEQPAWRWDAMMTAGVRAAYVASQHAARMMVPARRGLIVNISFWAAQKFLGNTAYGVSKAATDKLTFDTAHELRPHGVTVVSLYPGLVRTELVLAAKFFDLSNSESPEFIGRAVAALAGDPEVSRRSGQALVAAALATEYGFTDIDGRQPRALSLADV